MQLQKMDFETFGKSGEHFRHHFAAMCSTVFTISFRNISIISPIYFEGRVLHILCLVGRALTQNKQYEYELNTELTIYTKKNLFPFFPQ